jgi:putative MATE family efflux protein
MKKLDLSLTKSIFILSLPAIVEMGLNTMLGVADTIMISRLINPAAVAASGYSNSIMYMLIFVFASFNTGAIAMISRAYGEKNFDRVNRVSNQNFLLNLILGVLIAALSLIFFRQIFQIYDLAPNVRQYAYDYFTIIAWGMPFMFISFSIAASMRGVGDTKTPMIVVGISNLINVVFNYLLISGYGVFPELGIKGAAIATSFSRLLAAIIYLYLMLYKRKHLKFSAKMLRLQKDIFQRLWRLSLPGALEQFSMQCSFLVGGVIISQLATFDEASFRILISIESLSFMPAVGISIATATLVGKALGEKDYIKSLHTGYIAGGMSVAWGLIMGAVFILFPKTLLSAYTDDINLINISITTMIIAGFNQPLLNPMIALSGALRGAGDTKTVMRIVVLRHWIVFIPLTYLFILPLSQGVKGLWMAEIISFLIFLPIIFNRFKNMEWQHIQV